EAVDEALGTTVESGDRAGRRQLPAFETALLHVFAEVLRELDEVLVFGRVQQLLIGAILLPSTDAWRRRLCRADRDLIRHRRGDAAKHECNSEAENGLLRSHRTVRAAS